MNSIKIFLSSKPVNELWGKNKLLSYSDDSITIHYDEKNKYESVQKAGRKIEEQKLFNLSLEGSEWNDKTCFFFWLGFRHPKTYSKADINWPKYINVEEFTRKTSIIDWVRNVTNQPADVVTPINLSEQAIALIKQHTSKIKHHSIIGDELKKQNINGIYTVGKGSNNPAVLTEIDFNPTDDDNAPVSFCLVGKGITFDSGGYSLKPSQFMETMRCDMGGAAILSGALALAISKGLNKRVKLFLCCAENLVSDRSYKLGDIIHYRNDVSVEISNTDAEGRLVLADGLISAKEYNPDYLIDCATLTGAAKIAVGNEYHAVYSFDDDLCEKLFSTAQLKDERFWRLPLEEFHRSQISSSFADINNIGRPDTAGGSTAAAFLSYFISDYQKNWLHVDCSGVFRKSSSALWSPGATAIGVETIAELLLSL